MAWAGWISDPAKQRKKGAESLTLPPVIENPASAGFFLPEQTALHAYVAVHSPRYLVESNNICPVLTVRRKKLAEQHVIELVLFLDAELLLLPQVL